MRYSSHMEPLAARTLASHYTVMRQRYALTFSSCFDDSGSRSAGGHRPDARRPAFPGAARSRSGGDAAACDRSGRRRAGFCATAACRCLRAPDLSHFNVGAIARGVSGRWYFGGNMEFLGATMQQTVHAEQSAISHARLRGETSCALSR